MRRAAVRPHELFLLANAIVLLAKAVANHSSRWRDISKAIEVHPGFAVPQQAAIPI
jgi:hypothetical protein